LSSSFIWSIFFCAYIPATPPISQANTAVLLSVAVTLLLLKNKQISLYQFLDFVWLPLNHPRSGTMLFGITAYSNAAGTGADTINMSSSSVSSSVVLFLSKAYSSVIHNDPSVSSSALISVS